MKMPPAFWECVYAADRRKHKHRCRRCSRIVQPGEHVYMARVANGTNVLHEACGQAEAFPGVTELALLECHGMQYLSRCGYSAAQQWLDNSPLTKTRSAM